MQHFLLSSSARTLSLKTVFRMGEDVAYQTFCQMRWPETEGEAVCPRCGCTESYNIVTRRKFKCVACLHQFSVTSGTIFTNSGDTILITVTALAYQLRWQVKQPPNSMIAKARQIEPIFCGYCPCLRSYAATRMPPR